MILFIDNYDSFTYNLVDLIGSQEPDLKVVRNDKTSLSEIENMQPAGIIISPGPGRPEDAGLSCDVIRTFAGEIPILGICLGHQSIGHVYGGKVIRAGYSVHGKTSAVKHTNHFIFRDVSNPTQATRYHSLIIERETVPDCLDIIAETDDGIIMGVQHKSFPLTGLQFHPESILTTEGKKMLSNWLDKVRA